MPMPQSEITIGLVGDYSAEHQAHIAIPMALGLAAKTVGCRLATRWLPTQSLERQPERKLDGLDAIWCVPASPYASMNGALNAIRFARERSCPFLGTCGGFQHAVIEFARNVLGYRDADHAESNPDASVLFVTRLACSLAEAPGTVYLRPGTKAAEIFGQNEIVEEFNCNFGVSPKYQPLLEDKGLRICGVDGEAGARAIELIGHPFFMATLFQPERSGFSGKAHPLIVAFVRAAIAISAGILTRRGLISE